MYRQFFGLRELPFELAPDPRFLFLSTRHREALSNLEYAVRGRKGLVLLLGEAGTGKTTIMRAFLGSSAASARFVYVENPTLTRSEFYELLAARLGFAETAAVSKAHFLTAFSAAAAGDVPLVLIFDEAQGLPPELLEEVRLLSNVDVEGETQTRLSLVLAGQPELGERLEETAFQALKQRVALRCELLPFELADTAAYIGGRLRIAGGEPARIFTRDAVVAIHDASRGIPRTISVICDNALVTGFATDVKPVGRDIVLEVCRDFRLQATPLLPEPTAAPAVASPAEPQADPPLRPAPAVDSDPPAEPMLPPPAPHSLFSRLSRLFFRRRTTLGLNGGPSDRP